MDHSWTYHIVNLVSSHDRPVQLLARLALARLAIGASFNLCHFMKYSLVGIARMMLVPN